VSVRLSAALTAGAVAALVALAPLSASIAPVSDEYWGQWRGPDMTGVSPTATPPVDWSETRNVRWKLPIPGRASASPIVWGNHVYVLTAVSDSGETAAGVTHKFVVMAVDRQTGKVAWEKVAHEAAPHEGTHRENGTYASPSAVTDGEHLIASFESFGIYAYDMNGNPVWHKDLGDKRMRNQFGEGTTPALHGNTLIVNWDHQGQSFIVAFDKRTGEEKWRQNRDEIDSWFTPLIVEVNGRAQVITGALNKIQSYDLETGAVVWHTAGLTMNPIPSPVAADGMVYLMSGYRGNSLKAIRLADAKGDITGTDAIVWTYERDTPYVPSPLLYGDILYVLKSNSGILSTFEAKSGKPLYQVQRLEAVPNVFASPVGAAGRVYIAGREGDTVVLEHGPELKVLATNSLDDGFDASPALAGSEIYLRGYKNLYCIAEN
jgi:outer membrane protein assembly factor BamB